MSNIVRFTIEIETPRVCRDYRLVPRLGPDGAKEFLLMVDGVQKYRIVERPDGKQICDCPAYIYRGGDCKHLQALRALMVLRPKPIPMIVEEPTRIAVSPDEVDQPTEEMVGAD